MKKLIVLAMLALPVMAFSQERGGAVPPSNKVLNYSNNSEIYAEVVMSYGQGRGTCRIEMGESYKETITDKTELAAIASISELRFTNLADVLNAMNSIGFAVVGSYTVPGRAGTDAHVILEKTMKRRPSSTSKDPKQVPQVGKSTKTKK
jgi:hypothetical protein